MMDKEARRAYNKQYREKNAEALKMQKRQDWIDNKEKRYATQRAWRVENAEQTRVYNKQYRQKNKERLADNLREYRNKNREAFNSSRVLYHRKYRQSMLQYDKKWRDMNKEKTRRYQLKAYYGISLEDYNRMMEEQKGLCLGCCRPPKSGKLQVDHCHTSNKIRALLCGNCNRALGLVQDNPDTLMRLRKLLQDQSANALQKAV